MEKKCYAVHRKCNMVGYNSTYYVLAANKEEALKTAFTWMLGTSSFATM